MAPRTPKTLQQLLQQDGRSLTKLAAEMDSSASTLTRWQTGQMEPSISSCQSLAAVLGVSLQTIVAAVVETRDQARAREAQA